MQKSYLHLFQKGPILMLITRPHRFFPPKIRKTTKTFILCSSINTTVGKPLKSPTYPVGNRGFGWEE